MTRGECEKAILQKVLEIRDIYRQYVPDGECLQISIQRGSNGADWGDWKTSQIEFNNSTFQSLMPDGEYGAFENHKPLEVRYYEDDKTDPVYIESKKKFDEIYGDGAWDKEEEADKEWWDNLWKEHDTGMICPTDSHYYAYEQWLKKHGIEPKREKWREGCKSFIDVANMDVFKCSTWENDSMKHWKPEADHDE